LTGTPIANATEELWALLNFANPSVFHDKEGFLQKFGSVTDAQQVSELHTLLKPFLLRRVKDDVEKSLPPKEETILEVSLTPIQKTYYKAIYERNTSFLFKGAKPSNSPSLMNVMMELRKCCNHPYLVKGAEERILADAAAKLIDSATETKDGTSHSHTETSNLFAEQLVKSSGKMVLMEKLLHKLFVDGHKVLVFSQSTLRPSLYEKKITLAHALFSPVVRALDLLEELLKLKRYRYERLDGSTSSSSRAHAVDRFNRKSMQRFVMLLSTRAGGLGLNLTAADIVIIFDSGALPEIRHIRKRSPF
jgi:SNF2 family DNA or RNA helicase